MQSVKILTIDVNFKKRKNTMPHKKSFGGIVFFIKLFGSISTVIPCIYLSFVLSTKVNGVTNPSGEAEETSQEIIFPR